MKKFLLVLLFIISCISSCVYATETIPDFEKCEQPEEYAEYLVDMPPKTEVDLKISIKNGIITATPFAWERYSSLTVQDGAFEGSNRGEWGGSVKFSPWYNFLGLPWLKYTVVSDRGHGFYNIGNKKFVITGLSHLNTNRGNIHELVSTPDGWEARKIIDIGGCPEAFLLVDTTLYIVTSESILAVKEGVLHHLKSFDYSNWGHFLPKSMVYNDNCLFIGMRRGWLFKYDLKTKNQEWYRYTGKNLV